MPSSIVVDSPLPVHFVLLPFMAPGHMIPTVDFGRALAEHGMKVTVVTTAGNAARFQSTIDWAEQYGLSFQFEICHFPFSELGLPEGCENLDIVSSPAVSGIFTTSGSFMEDQLKRYILHHQSTTRNPICLVSDFCHMWTRQLTQELNIPRFIFYSVCCFTLLVFEIMPELFEKEGVNYEKHLVVPDIPNSMEVTKSQAAGFFPKGTDIYEKHREAEATADGFIVNTYHEMEPKYVELYAKAKGKKVWPVGPVSLCNKDISDQATRGSKSSVDETEVLSFLDSMAPKSVVYFCLGSLARTPPEQVIEIGMGLEESGHPFIWVIKSREKMPEVEAWLAGGFEERNKHKCLLIRGWASQVMILSHPSVGGFVTHCGWNSCMEGIAAGVPMATWPGFCDQFLNERFLVDVLGVGVMVGVKEPVWWWEDVVTVRRGDISQAVRKMMESGVEGEVRRKALEFSKKAKEAMEVGGSSYENVTALVEEVSKLVARRKVENSESNNGD